MLNCVPASQLVRLSCRTRWRPCRTSCGWS
jgi:hypothetical protein